MSGVGRAVGAAALVVIGVAIATVIVIPADAVDFTFPMGAVALAWYVAFAVAGVGALLTARNASRRGKRYRLRLLAGTGVAIILAGVATASVLQWQRGDVWPPQPQALRLRTPDSLPPIQQAAWAARIAAYAVSTADSASAGTVEIPADWPFPSGAELAIAARGDGGREVWARTGGATACAVAPRNLGGSHEVGTAPCGDPAPLELVFSVPLRRSTPALPAEGPRGGPWLQYRGDGARTAVAHGALGGASSWVASINGPVRSAASVADNVVLAGTHASGVLAALDIVSGAHRWHVTLPNWIHQDPVSDGRTVVVGFGDNEGSFDAAAPSGVAAHDVRTGRRLWVAFDESSVMTSPVIADSVVVYVTAAGVLRKRLLDSGRLVDERELPGGAIMGPPAMQGDTLVIGLDVNRVCAVLISTFETLWCRSFRGFREMGHSAVAASGGLVFASGGVLMRGVTMREMAAMPWSRFVQFARTLFDWRADYAGQRMMALDLATGRTRWSGRLLRTTRVVDGHISGTAALGPAGGAFVAPIADSLVGFDPASGEVRWTADARGARGSPLIVGDLVINAGADGVIESRHLVTGALRCRLERPVGYDRSGPALAASRLVFVDLDGQIEAIPTTELTACHPAAAPGGTASVRTGPLSGPQPARTPLSSGPIARLLRGRVSGGTV